MVLLPAAMGLPSPLRRAAFGMIENDEMERYGETLKAHLNHLKLEKESNKY